MNRPLLEVKDLTVEFRLKRGNLTAVDNVCFAIDEKETLGIVGETGCGKSATALSILRLISSPPGKIVDGEILFEGDDLLKKSEHEMEKIRGNKISMIFQEPMTSFNPSFTIGDQIAESYRIHLRHSKKNALESTEHILDAVRVPSPRTIMARYPHELSGGMRQRAMIAMALACQPRLLIADEPTTALDVTIQAQILELLEELQEKMKMAMLFISHNLAVMGRLCNRIGVMYAGSLVELADRKSLFTSPLHPYTIGPCARCRGVTGAMSRSRQFPETFAVSSNLHRAADFTPAALRRKKSAAPSFPLWKTDPAIASHVIFRVNNGTTRSPGSGQTF